MLVQHLLHIHSWSDPALPCSMGRAPAGSPSFWDCGDYRAEEGRSQGISPSATGSMFIHPARSATLWATRAPQVQQLCTFSVRREWGFLLGLTSGLPQLPLFLFSFSTLFYNHVNHSVHTIQSGFWLWIRPWLTCFPEELKGLRNCVKPLSAPLNHPRKLCFHNNNKYSPLLGLLLVCMYFILIVLFNPS